MEMIPFVKYLFSEMFSDSTSAVFPKLGSMRKGRINV